MRRERCRKIYGETADVNVAKILTQTAALYKDQKRHTEAVKLLQEAENAYAKVLGVDHRKTKEAKKRVLKAVAHVL